jgi:hypothetical protein
VLHPRAARSLFFDCQASSAKTLPKSVKRRTKESAESLTSPRGAKQPWPDPIAAHEKNRQLIEEKQQLVSPSTSSIAILPGACL